MARPCLNNSVKFKRLVQILRVPRPHARGYLECLWEVAYEHGDPLIGDANAVEASAEWPGEPGVLFDALLSCGGQGRSGFIEESAEHPGQYQIHDLWDHAPEYVRKRHHREETRRATGTTISDQRRRAAAAKHRQTSQNGDNHLQTDANGSRLQTNGGQRRTTATNGAPPTPAPILGEESPNNPSCPEPPSEASGPPILKIHDQEGEVSGEKIKQAPVMVFPVVGNKDKTEWPLYPDKVSQWTQCFPGIDVLAECRRAWQWCEDNPRNRKTFSGMSKFLNSWLSRSQNQAARSGVGNANGVGGIRRAGGGEFGKVRSGDSVYGNLPDLGKGADPPEKAAAGG